jgi:hypothetical protein
VSILFGIYVKSSSYVKPEPRVSGVLSCGTRLPVVSINVVTYSRNGHSDILLQDSCNSYFPSTSPSGFHGKGGHSDRPSYGGAQNREGGLDKDPGFFRLPVHAPLFFT